MKEKIIRIMYILIVLLLVTFGIKSILDYVNYTEANSAPFYVFILVNTIVYVFPAIAFFVIAKLITKTLNKENKSINKKNN